MLLIESRAMSSRPGVFHDIRNLELFKAPKTLSLPPGVIHVNHILEQFIETKALSSRPKIEHDIDNPELFITSKAQRSWPEVVHVNDYYSKSAIL